MKTRSEELEATIREALRMLAEGRPADAATLLEGGLDLALQLPSDRVEDVHDESEPSDPDDPDSIF